jgi:hypothetical protein
MLVFLPGWLMRALGGWPRYSQDPEGPGFIPGALKNFFGKIENRDFSGRTGAAVS